MAAEVGEESIELRPAVARDRDFLLALNLAAYREVVTRQFGWDQGDQEARFADKWASAAYRIVEQDGRAVGALWTRVEGTRLIVHEILVHPEQQNAGIGTATMRRVFDEADAQQLGVHLQVLRENRARALYQRLGLRVYGDSETHYLMRRPRYLGKAFAYVTRARAGRMQLLVFTHVDAPAAGLQVPAGTLEVGELPESAVVREAREETGLERFGTPALLGTRSWEMERESGPEHHTRHFFHLPLRGDAPERWRHDLLESDGAHTFELHWVQLPDGARELVAEHDALIDALMARL
jgi:8-oxo-dGTP pyrophosphatase MutT (NUDIX family)/GNAT superfamily N-acetyltransferase